MSWIACFNQVNSNSVHYSVLLLCFVLVDASIYYHVHLIFTVGPFFLCGCCIIWRMCDFYFPAFNCIHWLTVSRKQLHYYVFNMILNWFYNNVKSRHQLLILQFLDYSYSVLCKFGIQRTKNSFQMNIKVPKMNRTMDIVQWQPNQHLMNIYLLEMKSILNRNRLLNRLILVLNILN